MLICFCCCGRNWSGGLHGQRDRGTSVPFGKMDKKAKSRISIPAWGDPLKTGSSAFWHTHFLDLLHLYLILKNSFKVWMPLFRLLTGSGQWPVPFAISSYFCILSKCLCSPQWGVWITLPNSSLRQPFSSHLICFCLQLWSLWEKSTRTPKY